MGLSNLPYLKWLIIFVFIPSLIMWVFYWKFLIKYKKTIIFITVLAVSWGLVFDIIGSVKWGVWYYTKNLGIYFLGLPLEEYLILFFLPQQITAVLLLIRKGIHNA
jgi:lycopene cyclase domain-containing protein